ncbi:hypothetical protein Leryth_013720, partial [Lithospermum erythrorhizon]
MWRNIAIQVSSRTSTSKLFSSNKKVTSYSVFSRYCSFLGLSHDSIFSDSFISRPRNYCSFVSNHVFPEMGFRKDWIFCSKNGVLRRKNIYSLKHNGNTYGVCHTSYASVAEEVEGVSNSDVEEMAVSSSPDVGEGVSGVDEVQELLKELRDQEKRSAAKRRRQFRISSGMGYKKYKALRRRQVKIETEAWEQAANESKELLQDMCRHKLAPNLPYMKSLFLGWFEPLQAKIAEEQDFCLRGKSKATHAKYFNLLPADKMAVITMHKLMALLMTGTDDHHGYAKVVHAACSIGDAIEQEVRIHNFLEQTKKKKNNKFQDGTMMEDGKSSGNAQEQEHQKKAVSGLMKKNKLGAVNKILKRQDDAKPWGTEAKAKVGSRLIELLLQTAYIQRADEIRDGSPDIRPAFVHTFKTAVSKFASRRYGVIHCDPQILKGLEKTARHMVNLYMPMLIPPVKWTGYDKGAHIVLPSYIMRTHGARQQRDVVKRTPRKQLQPVFEALDTIGSTKWRVNKRVLNIIDRIWASGGRLADLVDREDIPLPEEPATDDEALLKKWRWKMKSVKKENRERYSQRCDIELKLAVARKIKDEEGFYYPHNLDFRGRVYPLHPHLNHLGSDVCRGILEFAEGRPLGESGLQWLKIHLANLYANGVDKLSSEGRITFTESHLDEIFDSADKPLEGQRWWLNAEDPFQCLAVCINLTEALRSTSPETTISHIPIHQDGSCNGLQHYAALGRDKLGAAAVNLVAGEKPADVYSGIASRVLEIMKRDANKDPAIFPDAMRARVLINQIDRKLVKQTVMTSVYGVTYIGARDQIKRRLKERDVIADDVELFRAACYAAKVSDVMA